MRADEQHWMVLQVLSDAAEIRANLDAERTQVCRGPNTGAHQQRGRLNAAAAKNDLACAEFARRPRNGRLHPYGAIALEDDLQNHRLRKNCKVFPLPRRGIEITD